jgi:DNA-binding NarL/FixJ family response regulator
VTASAPTRRAHVLIAAEQLPTRVGLRLALEPEARCTEAADAASAVASAVRDQPDVCLLGLDPSGQSLNVVNEIVTRVPSAAVIMLTSRLDEEEFMAAVRAGATGYLTNSLDPSRLPFVIQSALRGEPSVPRKFVSRLLDELLTRERRRSVVLAGRGRIALTSREWEVVELLLRGATTAEMADDLGVAPVTVRRHLGSVERKLGVSTRAQVVDLLSAEANTAHPV